MKIKNQINIFPKNIKIRNKLFEWDKKTYIMGILNITPDSFSDGGKFNSVAMALKEVDKMVENGVDILDIGGESTRPYADEVKPEDEIKRVLPILKAVRKKHPNLVISIDTRNAKTAKEAMQNGADIINDVSMASWDENILNTVKETDSFYIINHSKGTPETMQDNPEYKSVVDEIYKDLNHIINKALKLGIKKEKLIIDIGIGFGKTFEHNLELIKKIDEFSSLGFPILAGVSRKSVVSNIIGKDKSIEEKDLTTLVLNSYLASKKTNILRVHNVEMHQSLKAIDALIHS